MTDSNLVHLSISNINRVDNLDYSHFYDNETGKYKDAEITVGGKRYSVHFTDNTVKVRRLQDNAWGAFKGFFYQNKTATSRAIQDYLMPLMRQNAMAANTKRTLEAMDNRGIIGENREVAHYGFSNNRLYGEQGINGDNNIAGGSGGKQYNITTIDDYNAFVGIVCHQAGAENDLIDFTEKIKTGNFDYYLEKKPTDRMGDLNEIKTKYPLAKLQKWGSFLTDNAKRADIIGKLYNYLTKPQVPNGKKTGWAQEFAKNPDRALEKFVMKNLGFGDDLVAGDVEKVAALLKDYVLTVGSKESYEDKKAAVQEFMSGHFNKNRVHREDADRRAAGASANLYLMFHKVLNSAFFRQTSKIGLDFFRQEKTPVMFQISNHEGKTDTSKIHKDSLHIDAIGDASDKWWNNISTDEYDPNLYTAPITHSELRHVAKVFHDGNGLNMGFVKGHFE